MEASQWLDLSNSESPEFTGRAVVALAADPDVLRHTGKVHVVADLAREYGFTDIDGSTPRPLTLESALEPSDLRNRVDRIEAAVRDADRRRGARI